jgi:UrcA family protein
MKMLNSAVVLLFSVSLGNIACLPANAGNGASLSVKFVDLDVSRPEGAEQLYKRIRSAAVSVCGRLDSDAIGRQADFFACVDDAVARTVAKVDSPALYVVHGAKIRAQIPRG